VTSLSRGDAKTRKTKRRIVFLCQTVKGSKGQRVKGSNSVECARAHRILVSEPASTRAVSFVCWKQLSQNPILNAAIMRLDGRKCWVFLIVVILALVSIFKNSITLSRVQVIPTAEGPSSAETEPATPPLEPKPFLPPRNASLFRPVTSLARDCDPTPNQPLRSISSSTFSDYSNASRYFEMSPSLLLGHSTTGPAVCEFVAKGNSMHFAHTMQQLYGCYSFWQTNQNRPPVLLMPSKSVQTKLEKNAFLKGFFRLLKDSVFGLDIIPKNLFSEKYNTTSNGIRTAIDVSGGYILTHAKELSNLLTGDESNQSTPFLCKSSPRIGVLNRRKAVGRSIVNTQKLVQVMSTENGYNVSVEYFEDKSFQEQVDFFSSVDILLAPHGAQLTGLAFLQSTCSQLLELFPKGYAIPSFYGSLATNAGIGYSHLYLSDRPWQTEQAESLSQRIQARAADLCPSPDEVSASIRSLVQAWEECCRKKRRSFDAVTAS
jgi:hypothetical protein